MTASARVGRTETAETTTRVQAPAGLRPALSRATIGARVAFRQRRVGNRIMTKHRICSVSVASVYPHYVAKAEKKGRTKAEVDEIMRWLTGHTQRSLDAELRKKTAFEDFFAKAPRLNPARALITGVVCGVRVETIEEPTMQNIRYLDKLIDELAKGKAMEKILRA